MIGGLFNQIAGGKSPRLPELSALAVDVAIASTPCLFAAKEARTTPSSSRRFTRGAGRIRSAGPPFRTIVSLC
jgi:hypothetical protein